jgi:alkyl hydroperoxide reductase subunit AhpC
LCQHEEEIKQLNARVVFISFGAPEPAKIWLEQTCPSFRLLLDPERKVYSLYGLERSWLRSWNLRTLWYYFKALLAGRKLRGIQGDSAQLGGDFIVDAKGMLRLVHPNRDSADRPAVADLLTILRGLNE